MKDTDDFANLVESEIISELSSDLVRRAQAQRHQQLVNKSETGEMRSTGMIRHGKTPSSSAINRYHDTENQQIDADHRDRPGKFGDRTDVPRQKAENERERGRNLKRGAAINTAAQKLNGSARVPSK